MAAAAETAMTAARLKARILNESFLILAHSLALSSSARQVSTGFRIENISSSEFIFISNLIIFWHT